WFDIAGGNATGSRQRERVLVGLRAVLWAVENQVCLRRRVGGRSARKAASADASRKLSNIWAVQGDLWRRGWQSCGRSLSLLCIGQCVGGARHAARLLRTQSAALAHEGLFLLGVKFTSRRSGSSRRRLLRFIGQNPLPAFFRQRPLFNCIRLPGFQSHVFEFRFDFDLLCRGLVSRE